MSALVEDVCFDEIEADDIAELLEGSNEQSKVYKIDKIMMENKDPNLPA